MSKLGKSTQNSIIAPIYSAFFFCFWPLVSLVRTKNKSHFSILILFCSCSFLIQLRFFAAPGKQTTFRSRFRSLEWNAWGFYDRFFSVFIVCFFALPISRVATSLRANPANWHIKRESWDRTQDTQHMYGHCEEGSAKKNTKQHKIDMLKDTNLFCQPLPVESTVRVSKFIDVTFLTHIKNDSKKQKRHRKNVKMSKRRKRKLWKSHYDLP